jgi:hypothetical protein
VIAAVTNKWIQSVVVAAVLLMIAAFLIRSHRRAWAKHELDDELDDADRLHYRGQYRRRMQASGLLGLIGLLIVFGDLGIDWTAYPLLFSFYWMGVLGATFYLIVLGLLDAFATAAHTRASLARLRQRRGVLERQAAELRQELSSELPVD